ncbi:MAG: reverse transcriptase domain-containing protein, partial [Cyanobacteria bacterium J06553_1]
MDFREVNSYIDAYTRDADVCADKMREWRKMGAQVTMVDLAKAYLQVRVERKLWPYQTVIVRGQRYCLTRLGFGLNVAPLVMKAVLNAVLGQNDVIRAGTSAYVDDVMVREDVVAVKDVVAHLNKFGLACKPPESMQAGARALGLQVWGERGVLRWRRGGSLPEVPQQVTRREVFSVCGKLLGHYPVCGWLRARASFLKRKASRATEKWDDLVDDVTVVQQLTETVMAVRENDPVKGRWDVSGKAAVVWVDASSIALGAVLEVDGCAVEDACWLRKEDAGHINMAELDAVIKGLNLVLAWKITEVELKTDSATVYQWISDGLTGKSRLRTKAASEMLVRRRVAIVTALVEEYGLSVEVTLVPSRENKADALTRVP